MENVKNKKMISKISDLLVSYINNYEDNDKQVIVKSLHTLLNGNYKKYDLTIEKAFDNLSKKDLQKSLYKLNERTEIQKETGVYYTPEDVCKYIIWNSIIMKIDPENTKTYKEDNALNFIIKQNQTIVDKILFEFKFIDPTCGSAEFLINLFKIKFNLLIKTHKNFTDSDIYNISKTIYGNDILEDSTDISKIRLFIEICEHFKDKKYICLLAKILQKQFTNLDYVLYNKELNNKFDFVIGNPPYVEYGKFKEKDKLVNKYGNIYADVIHNSIDTLKPDGVLGFIVPLSYVSTSRMNAIRKYVYETTNRQFILSFADRPDCLFQGVHQKLNIVIAKKGKQEHTLFTSNYKHWYKEERKELLNGCEIKENKHLSDLFIPKIGNDIEESIYRKITTSTGKNLFDIQSQTGSSLFLNMRGCFWIKSFSFNPGSKEYKEFVYEKNIIPFINCLLNSSLFWIYWTIISDCWHITSKELKGFFVPTVQEHKISQFYHLFKNLENKLEKTKKYIGSKQTEYEYKHKCCKNEIDMIDDCLAEIYDLTKEELTYIKNYALKYRTGGSISD